MIHGTITEREDEMATTRELSDELDTHINSIRGSMDDIDRTVRTNTEAIGRTKVQRTQALRGYAQRLLPNLELSTLQAIGQRVPDFVRSEDVQAQVQREEGVFQRQIDRLLATFNPKTYASERNGINIKLTGAREDLALTKGSFDELDAIDGLTSLIDNGYGTSAYPHRWWSSLQFYTDWRNADNAVETAKVADWNALRQQFLRMRGDVQAQEAVVNGHAQELKTLDDAHTRYDELVTEKQKVAVAILEQLQTKLQARLESLDPIPTWMGDVRTMNETIARLEAENTVLQGTRAQLARDLGNLQGVKTKVLRSGRREVPDDYLVQLKRSGRHNRQTATSGRTDTAPRSMRPPGSSGYSSAPVEVHHHYYGTDTSFYDALLFTQLSEHYEREEPRSWGRSGGGYHAPSSHRDDGGYSNSNNGHASSRVDYSRQS